MATRSYFQPRRHHTISETELEDRADAARGYELERARSADAAWRAGQARKYQRWIDRAHWWEREGRRWLHTPEESVGHAVLGVIVIGGGLAPGNPDPRLLPLMGVMFGMLIILRPLLGMSLHGSARLGRRFWLRSARRANVEVSDPGNVSLVRPDDLPEAPGS